MNDDSEKSSPDSERRFDAFISYSRKDKAFALGPEVTLALARKNVVVGSLTARYYWETYARTTTQGSGFLLQVSFLTKPIHLPTK